MMKKRMMGWSDCFECEAHTVGQLSPGGDGL